MKSISITVVTSPNCQICARFDDFWKKIEKNWPNVFYKKVDVTTTEGRELAQKYIILASPAIIINEELWAVGGYDEDKFLEKLKTLS